MSRIYAILCLWLASVPAAAATIEYEFSGAVGTLEGEVPIAASLGDPFRVVATFRDAPNLCLQPNACSGSLGGTSPGTRGAFQGSGSLALGSIALEDFALGAGTYDDFNDPYWPLVRDYLGFGADLGDSLSAEPAELRFWFEGPAGPLGSAELPTQFSLDAWPPTLLVIAFSREGSQIGEVNAVITQASVRVTPEPAIAALAAAALLALSARRRAASRAAPRSDRR